MILPALAELNRALKYAYLEPEMITLKIKDPKHEIRRVLADELGASLTVLPKGPERLMGFRMEFEDE